MTDSLDRRRFLLNAATAAVALPASSAIGAFGQVTKKTDGRTREEKKAQQEGGEEEVTTNEDLMREHGVLRRVLLVYHNQHQVLTGTHADGKAEFNPDALLKAAGMVRHFVEDYHEKLEENYIFPRLRKANKETDLVAVLLKQHQAGRTLTARLQANLSAHRDLNDASKKQEVIRDIASFIRMYQPHAAREDTILFPAFRSVISKHEYDSLGDEFEDEEKKMFGEDGFEKMVAEVAAIERDLGIYDLAQFTPET